MVRAQQLAELIAQRLGQMGVDLRGSQAGMSQQDLDDADVHAPLEHVRGEAVAERVRVEARVKTTLVPRFGEGGPCAGVAQVGQKAAAGEEPLRAAVGLPYLRSMSRIDSVKGRMRSLLPFPMTRSTICLESTAVMGSVTASVIRSP